MDGGVILRRSLLRCGSPEFCQLEEKYMITLVKTWFYKNDCAILKK